MASSTTQSQAGNVWSSQARNVEARDVGCVASEQVMARTMMPTQNGLKHCEGESSGSFDGKRQIGIVETLEYGLGHGIGARKQTVVHPSPWSDSSSEDLDFVHVPLAQTAYDRPQHLKLILPGAVFSKADRQGEWTEEALQEAEDAFMAADSKYNMARANECKR